MIPTTFVSSSNLPPGLLGAVIDLGAVPLLALAAIFGTFVVLVAGVVVERRDAAARRLMADASKPWARESVARDAA